ncbi:MAG: FeoB small GTPase domain-containing protein [Gemmatimonadota bacterium]|jgi:ferrous iron transport protein B|nr:iron transporter FeoB [Gemmatimonadota bacterium]MDP6529119.1 FeoB small GTPase domain-containing protein [Gemmatimonadota bacterium]MDP7032174.1 FeoB small GTPase domain-containing protein [Gemmatimonadota bacterium]
MGVSLTHFDRVVALAGNPNTGKSSVFNHLTGLRQRTGNWPGKTVARAEGGFAWEGVRYKLVDLPGTYSLLSASQDEEIARDFILFGQPDCTVVVVDSTALERNLNLVLQVLEITPRAVVCVNLMDEARRKGITVDARQLSRDLGVPAVPTSARTGEGLADLVRTVAGVTDGSIPTAPRLPEPPPEVQAAVDEMLPLLHEAAPGLPSARWVAYRLLEGDLRVRRALETGELASLGVSRPKETTP